MKRYILSALLLLTQLPVTAATTLQKPEQRTFVGNRSNYRNIPANPTNYSFVNTLVQKASPLQQLYATSGQSIASLWSSVARWIPSQIKEHPILTASSLLGSAAALIGLASYRSSWLQSKKTADQRAEQARIELLRLNIKKQKDIRAEKNTAQKREKENNALKNTLAETEKRLDTLTTEYIKSKIENSLKVVETKQQTKEITQLTERLQQLETDLQNNRTQLQSIQNENQKLSDNWEILNKQKTDLETKNHNITEKNQQQADELNEKLGKLTNQKKELENQIKNNEQEIKKLGEQIKLQQKKQTHEKVTQTESKLTKEIAIQTEAPAIQTDDQEEIEKQLILANIAELHKNYFTTINEANQAAEKIGKKQIEEEEEDDDENTEDAAQNFIAQYQGLQEPAEQAINLIQLLPEDEQTAFTSLLVAARTLQENFIRIDQTLQAEEAAYDVEAQGLETSVSGRSEFADLQKNIIGGLQVARHINKFIGKYKSIDTLYTSDHTADITNKIQSWIQKGGKIWHNLDTKESLNKEEVTQLFWFLYSQGLLQGLVRTGPENYSYILDESAKGAKLFELLQNMQFNGKNVATPRKASHLKKSDGFTDQQTYEIALWGDEDTLFLPLGMKTILFMSATETTRNKTVYLFKPEPSAGAITLSWDLIEHAGSFLRSQATKKAAKWIGSEDDLPKYQKERIPAFLHERKTPIFANTDQKDQKLIQEFYGHFGDIDRRVGNEISINTLTTDTAAWYAGASKKQKEQLEASYQEMRRQSMQAWAEHLFNQQITKVQDIPFEIFIKQGQEMLYDNIVAEVYPKVADRQTWLQDKDDNLQTQLNKQDKNSKLHQLLNKLVENNE